MIPRFIDMPSTMQGRNTIRKNERMNKITNEQLHGRVNEQCATMWLTDINFMIASRREDERERGVKKTRTLLEAHIDYPYNRHGMLAMHMIITCLFGLCTETTRSRCSLRRLWCWTPNSRRNDVLACCLRIPRFVHSTSCWWRRRNSGGRTVPVENLRSLSPHPPHWPSQSEVPCGHSADLQTVWWSMWESFLSRTTISIFTSFQQPCYERSSSIYKTTNSNLGNSETVDLVIICDLFVVTCVSFISD